MTAFVGNFSLSAVVLVAAVVVLAVIVAIRGQAPGAMRVARWGLALMALLYTLASAALFVALLGSDFSFQYVVDYTELALPTGYKLAAFWAGQGGSLLLWGWILAIMCAAAAWQFRRENDTTHGIALAVMSLVTAFFAVLMLHDADPLQGNYTNPFTTVVTQTGLVPLDGRGMNPMLQDPFMLLHPPLLFVGYAGYTIPFAVLIGVLIAGRSDNRWLGPMRRWILFSWVFLTAGIVLGAWWAYIELGWGGYWAWDPVENASLLPWLTSTALVHSIMVQQHRGMFKFWNAGLIAASFILCIVATYLTRSGVIQSVHAFPADEDSLITISDLFLAFILLCTALSIGLIIWRRRALKTEHEIDGLISREGAFLAANLLLVVMAAVTLIGTIFPLISNLVGEPITVKPPFYNKVVAPMGLLLAFIMAHGPVLAYGKTAAKKIVRDMTPAGIAALIVTLGVAIVVAWQGAWSLSALAWTTAAAFIAMLGTFTVIIGFGRSTAARQRSTSEPWHLAAVRLIDADHRRYGGQVIHLGVMMLIIGVVGSSLFNVEQTPQLHPGESAQVGRYTITYQTVTQRRFSNFTAYEASLLVQPPRGRETMLHPQMRFFDKWEQRNIQVALRSRLREDVYATFVGFDPRTGLAAFDLRVNPLVVWIWIGGLLMLGGGTFCMLPRLLPRVQHATQEQTQQSSADQSWPHGDAFVEPAAQELPREVETTQ